MRKYTIAQFNKEFPDDNACLEWLKNYVYPSGVHCQRCKCKAKRDAGDCK